MTGLIFIYFFYAKFFNTVQGRSYLGLFSLKVVTSVIVILV